MGIFVENLWLLGAEFKFKFPLNVLFLNHFTKQFVPIRLLIVLVLVSPFLSLSPTLQTV